MPVELLLFYQKSFMVAKILRKATTKLRNKDLLTRWTSVGGKVLQIQERIYQTTILYQVTSYVYPLTFPVSFSSTRWGARIPSWSLGRSENKYRSIYSHFWLSKLFFFFIFMSIHIYKQWTMVGKHLGENTSHYWIWSSGFFPPLLLSELHNFA